MDLVIDKLLLARYGTKEEREERAKDPVVKWKEAYHVRRQEEERLRKREREKREAESVAERVARAQRSLNFQADRKRADELLREERKALIASQIEDLKREQHKLSLLRLNALEKWDRREREAEEERQEALRRTEEKRKTEEATAAAERAEREARKEREEKEEDTRVRLLLLRAGTIGPSSPSGAIPRALLPTRERTASEKKVSPSNLSFSPVSPRAAMASSSSLSLSQHEESAFRAEVVTVRLQEKAIEIGERERDVAQERGKEFEEGWTKGETRKEEKREQEREERERKGKSLAFNVDLARCYAVRTLHGEEIGDEGAQLLSQYLRAGHCPRLQCLSLSRCCLTSRGLSVLAKALGEGNGKTIVSLSLPRNCISAWGVKELCSAFRSGYKSLQRLNLEGNSVEDEGALSLSHEVLRGSLSSLLELRLQHNHIGNRGGEALWKAFTAERRCCPKIEMVNIRYNRIEPETSKEWTCPPSFFLF